MSHHQQTSDQPAGESAEPTQTAARQEQVEEGTLASHVLYRPDDLRACQAAEDAGHTGVQGVVRQPRPPPLTVEQPEAYQCGHGHQHTEAGDLELADAEQNGVDGGSFAATRPAFARGSRCASAESATRHWHP